MDFSTAAWTAWLLAPGAGLAGLFIASFISATVLPMGSEVVLIALLKAQPSLLVEAVAVATLGNTLGGAVTWWMGRRARALWERWRPSASESASASASPSVSSPRPPSSRARRWLERHGAAACLLAWLPGIGDALCAAAGWLQMPFGLCLVYMAIGKFLRYAALAAALSWA